jgi:hypothetical protein
MSIKISYNIGVLFIFALFEVLLFKNNNFFKLSISILEYLFVLFIFFQNKEIGIMYFFSFVLLTIGLGNYEGGYQEMPLNFWGLRLIGFSVNILFSIILALFCNIKFIDGKRNLFMQFLIFLIVYGLVIGIIRCLQGVNYIDNFFSDLLTYFPALIYLLLLSKVSVENVFRIIKYAIPVSVFIALASAITGNQLNYGNDTFCLQNAISFMLLPFALLLLRKWYKHIHWMIMVFIMIYLLVTGNFFISGKIIIVCFIVLVWYVVSMQRKYVLGLIIPLVLVFLSLDSILLFFQDFFSGHVVILAKLIQVRDGLKTFSDPFAVASIPSSMGNIVAECITVCRHLWEHPSFLIFGEGFGGGVKDYYGWLAPFAGHSGYADVCFNRNDYFKMHLPIFEMALKGGIIMLLLYIGILYKALVNRQKSIGILLFLLLFMTFYVAKEHLLLTLLFAKLIGCNCFMKKEIE